MLGSGLVCLLPFTHCGPLVYSVAACCMIPVKWAIDAYRDEKPLRFVVVATLLSLTTLPLLHTTSRG